MPGGATAITVSRCDRDASTLLAGEGARDVCRSATITGRGISANVDSAAAGTTAGCTTTCGMLLATTGAGAADEGDEGRVDDGAGRRSIRVAGRTTVSALTTVGDGESEVPAMTGMADTIAGPAEPPAGRDSVGPRCAGFASLAEATAGETAGVLEGRVTTGATVAAGVVAGRRVIRGSAAGWMGVAAAGRNDPPTGIAPPDSITTSGFMAGRSIGRSATRSKGL